MRSSDNSCFICGGNNLKTFDNYKRCSNCFHETIAGEELQQFIINKILNVNYIKKDFLFLFMKFVTVNSVIERNLLIDVGSGAGQFLYYIKSYFKKVVGVEITDECYNFSKKELNLNVYKNIEEIRENYSIATFWHSLEHIPVNEIKKILSHLNEFSTEVSKIIISVPNSDSWQFMLFKKDNAFYDYPNHLHQFSYRSLIFLLDKYNFELERDFYSFYYIFFGYIQGFLNKVNKIHNYFYYRKKRGFNFCLSKKTLLLLDFKNYLFIMLFLVPALFLTLCEYFKKEKRAIITLCFKKKKN